ncbi:DoxX family protein [Microbacterium capsulatum]|uniref:DoxX family protein n=1 Tax=Microbacterium capsulatum TaxID=3041921 RepID=A0ABU0XIG3_9MICO|nr:DoxX family protein [Microbacterium sp. ASV81]MDQ4214930.1 DoxX family protein [Microbacterium sp. ASV81]
MLVLTILTWVLSGLLALVNLMAGGMKILKPHGGARPMPTLDAFTDGQVRWIGVAEVAGAIGLILPPLLGVLPWLAPVAALGLAVIQILAVFAHRRHGEPFVPNIVMAVIAAAIGVLRLVGA